MVTARAVPAKQLAVLCRSYHVRELAIFGSALGDDVRPSSDIDLLVDFEPDAAVTFLLLGRTEQELADLFGHRIDLAPESGLKPLLRQSVLGSARVLYAA